LVDNVDGLAELKHNASYKSKYLFRSYDEGQTDAG
jgi:hypothetical protein